MGHFGLFSSNRFIIVKFCAPDQVDKVTVLDLIVPINHRNAGDDALLFFFAEIIR